MIQIVVSKPIKISGLYSVKATFPYNEELLNFIRSLEGPCVFHKKDLLWELPIYHLGKFLDMAVHYDSVDLTISENEITKISGMPLTDKEINSFKIKPYSHQIEAINFGLSHNKWLLLDSMGLGKTCEAICLAETLHNRGQLEHCLVICGVDSLRQNWKTEIQKFSNLPVRVLGEKLSRNNIVKYETLAKRAEELKQPIEEFFVVVNITNIRDTKFIEAFQKSCNKFDMIIFDECHRSSAKSLQGTNILKLDAKYKVAMTGTLILNSPISAFLPLSWTGNDKATLTNFKNQYCVFSQSFGHNTISGYKNLDILQEEINTNGLRRTFDQVRGDMPKKTVEYELVEMMDEDQKFYEAIKEGVKEEADKIELNTNNLLALMTRLRQATSCPSILTTDPPESSKLTRAAELAEDLLESGEKVIIMANFKESVYTLATKLEKFHPMICTGDQSEDLVQRNIDSFRNSNNFNILVGTMGKIGTGFSMPECHYMIFIDQPYTQAMFDQCCDRIYRITSDQPVYIKVLVDNDTVDERVREIVEMKRDLADFMIDGKQNARFTDELKSIISCL